MEDDIRNTNNALLAGPDQAQKHSDLEPLRKAKRSADSSERDAMFARLEEIVLDGLRHGFFDCQVTCELVNDRKRRVVIKAGKSHLLTIREEELRN